MTVHVLSPMAIVMRREAVQGAMARWQSHRWVLDDVVPHEVGFGEQPRCLRQTDADSLWLYPDWSLALYTDDTEGYWLNASAPTPSFFVMWRLQGGPDGPDSLAVPQALSLSYHDAGRWLDAQETVENVPVSPEVLAQMRSFVEVFHVPEVKKRQRPQSFQGLKDRFGQPASVSTEEKRRTPGGAGRLGAGETG